MKNSKIFFSIIVCLLSGIQLFAQKVTTRTITNSRTTVKAGLINNIKIVDTAVKDIKTKVISRELPIAQNGDIYINNSYRKINVLPSADNKFKIETIAYYT
ncbi:MAG: hypothetical protein ABIP35_15635, partial [Ginsengibacter sp.]